jgi:aarF domain-containing kinase
MSVLSLRLSCLPMNLQLLVMSAPCSRRVITRHASTWHPLAFTSVHARVFRHSTPRKILWLIPITAGLLLYVYPDAYSVSNLFASSTVIPCPAPKPPHIQPTIFSPAEPHRSILSRILALLRDKIWEPIRTGLRFVHLVVLFMPVLISAPMILIGSSEKRYHGEKWGAVWWYGLLVRKMEAAGPTFIKVRGPCSFKFACVG